MLGEKETEQVIPDMSQIENVDDVIRILFGVPPRRGGDYHLRKRGGM